MNDKFQFGKRFQGSRQHKKNEKKQKRVGLPRYKLTYGDRTAWDVDGGDQRRGAAHR